MDASVNTTDSLDLDDDAAGVAPRLPCRGCLKNCPDYQRCEGKPWRLGEGSRASPDAVSG